MNLNKLMYGPNVAGQSLVDRVMAAKHSLAGQGLAKSVCKATTEEVMPPKKKHVDYLIQCTHEPNVSIPHLAGLLIERSQNLTWVSVYKALLTSHSLMNHGNERYTQYLASNNCSFKLENFTDKTSPQGYDMSPHIRRYAKYVNSKAVTYRAMAFDFCKIKKGKDDGLLRIMDPEKLLKALPTLQSQVDCLLEFEVTKAELNNSVIFASFMMLFKDLIRLLACYNDAIINLLAKFFDMNKKECKDALDIYRKFVVRMEGVGKFFAVAESVGIEKGDIPDLAQAPSTLLEALEAHMKSLDGTKKGSSKSKSVVDTAITSMTTTVNNTPNQLPDDFFADDLEALGDSMKSNNPFADFGDAPETDENQDGVQDGEQDGDIGNNPFMFGDADADLTIESESEVLDGKNPWDETEESNVDPVYPKQEDFSSAFDATFDPTEDSNTAHETPLTTVKKPEVKLPAPETKEVDFNPFDDLN